MQQHRLMRSRTEKIMSGVCGGLGEYLGVDPVIVRLIFVLVTLTTGLGVLVYPALWVAMPLAPPRAPLPPLLGFGGEPYVVQREREQVAVAARYGEVPPPSAYNFDPVSGERLYPSGSDQSLPAGEQPNQPASGPVRARQMSKWFAFGLIAFGGLILADNLNLNIEFMFPLLMIGIGVFLLRRR
ncbi:MAG: PspC domain-containing protein [Roseiflexaceae bacterium]|nr:PspC domain-containing protein [Roseiflexaceae bacterium]